MNGIPTIGIRVTDTEQPELFTEIDIANTKYIDMEVLGYVPEISQNKAAQFAIAELIHSMPEAEIRGEIPEAIQKKVQIIESREKQADQLKEITDKLEQGVAEVFSSDKYKQFLDTMAKFPRYSVNNNILSKRRVIVHGLLKIDCVKYLNRECETFSVNNDIEGLL